MSYINSRKCCTDMNYFSKPTPREFLIGFIYFLLQLQVIPGIILALDMISGYLMSESILNFICFSIRSPAFAHPADIRPENPHAHAGDDGEGYQFKNLLFPLIAAVRPFGIDLNILRKGRRAVKR